MVKATVLFQAKRFRKWHHQVQARFGRLKTTNTFPEILKQKEKPGNENLSELAITTSRNFSHIPRRHRTGASS